MNALSPSPAARPRRTSGRSTTFAELFAVLCCVTACGGGGSSDSAAAPSAAPAPGPTAAPAPVPGSAPAPAPTPVPFPAPPPAPAATAGSTCNITGFAAVALAKVNQLRAAGADCRSGGKFAPAAPLAWNALLTQAAEAHTQDMVAKNFFSHTGSNGSTLKSRIDATGYGWSALGENIAAGQNGIDAVMNGWMASDGHCANIMGASYAEIGLVCVPGTSANTYNPYWTMDLARPR
jgi:uncharacterized protein YkwD